MLAALGELRMPPGLLTTKFRKLVADKQAQEHAESRQRYSSGESNQNHSPCSPAVGSEDRSSRLSSAGFGVLRDDEWARLAEGHDVPVGDGGVSEGEEVKGHLKLVVRALLMCTASRSSLRVRQAAAELLGEADLPRAMDASQVMIVRSSM